MAKVRLVAWLGALGMAAVVLLDDVRWSEDPAVAVMAVVRVVAGVLAAYLGVATLAALARVRLPAPAIVRRLVAGAIGTGILVAPMTASAATRQPAPIEAPVLRQVPESSQPAPVPAPPVAAAVVDEVTAAPGDHLWAIAERTLSVRLGRPATDAEIVPFWQAVIAANRDRLADPDDANLIFPGQTFVVP